MRPQQYLHPKEGDAGQQIHCGLQVLQPFGAAGREVVLKRKEGSCSQNSQGQVRMREQPPVASGGDTEAGQAPYPVHGEVDAQGVVQLVQEFDKAIFLQRNAPEAGEQGKGSRDRPPNHCLSLLYT